MPSPSLPPDPSPVTNCQDLPHEALRKLASRYGLTVEVLADQHPIKGSYWGDREAGLARSTLYIRTDTPVHSALHELCHFVCMSTSRRASLETDAGGDYAEENAVCYLQILLADFVPPMTKAVMLRDMDLWGYSFRLGSAARWFDDDAGDARDWLLDHALIDGNSRPTWRLRGAPA